MKNIIIIYLIMFTLFVFDQVKTRVILNETCLQNASKILKYAKKYNLSTRSLYITDFNQYSDKIQEAEPYMRVTDG
jgi:hypothetical protein